CHTISSNATETSKPLLERNSRIHDGRLGEFFVNLITTSALFVRSRRKILGSLESAKTAFSGSSGGLSNLLRIPNSVCQSRSPCFGLSSDTFIVAYLC